MNGDSAGGFVGDSVSWRAEVPMSLCVRSVTGPAMSPGRRHKGLTLLVTGAGMALMSPGLPAPRPATAMDLVRTETRVSDAGARFGVSGANVLVAVMDRGIDWRNADFRKPDGTTRIQYIFDLTDDTGAAQHGNAYGKGTIYTRQQIDNALTGGSALATRDAVGHGTTTTGIAAGGGRNNSRYRGIAPNASIISVKITSDGAPAHGSQPAEAPYYDPARIPVAIDFIRAKAAELGMPCVMLLNLGTQEGPTDGTSELARKIDSTVGPGVPGLAFVTGTGDEGGMPNRAGGTVPPGGTVDLRVQKGGAGPLRLDLWYAGGDRFDLVVHTPSQSYGPYAAPATENQTSAATEVGFSMYHRGADWDFYNSPNGKREVLIDFTGPPGTYRLELRGAVATNGRFDATLNPSFFWNPSTADNKFLNFIAPGSIWDGATARNNIAPNSYVVRNQWTDIDGVQRTISGEGAPGEIWRGSSIGPTFDGRLGVSFSAPGDSLFTTYNPTSYWATFRFNLVHDGAGLYGRANAVSAAAPIVAGVIALMLELRPTLNAATIKRILEDTARTDAFTGPTPNTTWGHGKLDAEAALARVEALGDVTADFDGDKDTDRSVYRNGAWFAEGQPTAFLGTATDIPVPGDFDADGRADKAVYREGIWFTLGQPTRFFGLAGDVPVPGDYDGDGDTDRAVFRPSVGGWYVEGQDPVFFGLSTDIPVPADYDGDGDVDRAVFRPSVGGWYVDGLVTAFVGLAGDIPVPGDYNGDGDAERAIFRPAVGGWYVEGMSPVFLGLQGDAPVPGDYDGDGDADRAIFRGAVGGWYVDGLGTVFLGLGSDTPLPLPQAVYRRFFSP